MTPVEFHFVLPTGEPFANSTVEIQLARSSYSGALDGVTVPRLITFETDGDGRATLELWPSTTLYYVNVQDSISEAGLSYKFIVPEVSEGTTLRLQDIVVDAPMSGVTYDDAALLAILDSKANAAASAIAASVSAAEAAASASAAAASAASGAGGNVASVAGKTGVVTLVKADVGLANVDNTSDANKPVSTAQATAIATSKAEAKSEVTTTLLGGAPAAALDTLLELGAALGNDANYAATTAALIAAKATDVIAGLSTATSADVANGDTLKIAIGKLAAKAALALRDIPGVTTAANAASAGDLSALVDAIGAVPATLGASIAGAQNLTSANANRTLKYSSAVPGTLTAALDANTGCTSDEYWMVLTDPAAGGVPSITNGVTTIVGGPGVILLVTRRGVDDYMLNAIADATSVVATGSDPRFVSAAIANASPTLLDITFSAAITGAAAPAAAAFSLTNSGAAQTISSVARAGSIVTLTLSRATLYGEVVYVTYTPPSSNPLQTATGDLALGFGSKFTTNNVASAAVLLRLTPAGTVPPLETQPGGTGTPYTYKVPAGNVVYGTCYAGSPTVSLPANNATDAGWFATLKQDPATTTPAALGLHTSGASVAHTSYIYGIQAINTFGGNYKVYVSGASTTANGTATASADGDILRLVRLGGTNTIIAQIARAASPTTWITLHTFAATTVAQLFPQLSLGDTSTGAVNNGFHDVQHFGMT